MNTLTRAFILIGMSFSVALTGAPVRAAGVQAALPPNAAAPAPTSAEGQLLTRLNEIRASGVSCPGSGLRPVADALQSSGLHALSALKQASYMAQSGGVTHIGPGGSTPRLRAASTGIQSVSVTEIVYMGSGLDPEAAMQWWLHSPVHCFYMTDARYTTAGASVVRGNRGTAYVMVLTSTPR